MTKERKVHEAARKARIEILHLRKKKENAKKSSLCYVCKKMSMTDFEKFRR